MLNTSAAHSAVTTHSGSNVHSSAAVTAGPPCGSSSRDRRWTLWLQDANTQLQLSALVNLGAFEAYIS